MAVHSGWTVPELSFQRKTHRSSLFTSLQEARLGTTNAQSVRVLERGSSVFKSNFCQQRPRHRKTLGKLSRCRAACAIRSTSGSHLDPYRLNKAFEWNAMLLFWFNDRWGVSCHKKHKRTQKMQWRNINELCDSRIPSAGLAITKDHLPGAPLESRL